MIIAAAYASTTGVETLEISSNNDHVLIDNPGHTTPYLDYATTDIMRNMIGHPLDVTHEPYVSPTTVLLYNPGTTAASYTVELEEILKVSTISSLAIAGVIQEGSNALGFLNADPLCDAARIDFEHLGNYIGSWYPALVDNGCSHFKIQLFNAELVVAEGDAWTALAYASDGTLLASSSGILAAPASYTQYPSVALRVPMILEATAVLPPITLDLAPVVISLPYHRVVALSYPLSYIIFGSGTNGQPNDTNYTLSLTLNGANLDIEVAKGLTASPMADEFVPVRIYCGAVTISDFELQVTIL